MGFGFLKIPLPTKLRLDNLVMFQRIRNSEMDKGYERNDIIRQFEEAIAKHCGAPYGIAVESCTAALFMCCLYLKVKEVTIPKKTYFSVPMSIIHSSGSVKYADLEWRGVYTLLPYPIIDSAMRFKKNMCIPGTFHCLSFH